ncbi:MAG: tRNA (guanosine(37)-N1)-methyltransferase TrmD [Acidobacteria bacterium]|nr:tRNA (guanosine(37)-N1)-methyltransferase TrmD [Acidobacteriota bacterium]
MSLDLDDLVAIGVIRKPHGVRGEASVESWTDDPERYTNLRRVILLSPDRTERLDLEVISARSHAGRELVLFSGIETPERIDELRGWTLEIPQDERRELDEGEYWIDELVGLEMVDTGNETLGRVVAVGEGGGGLLLTVRRPEGETFDVPFVGALLPVIDPAEGRIVADLPEGLIDERNAEAVPVERTGAASRPAVEPLSEPRLLVDVITIFPGMFDAIRAEGVIGRAIGANILELRVHDLRDYATDRHRSTDDAPYGGGEGMVMLAEPIFRCVDAIREGGEGGTVLLPSPQGRHLDQPLAGELAGRSHLIIICGRYEGVDERVLEGLRAMEISIGDFVVSGGELPTMVLIDAIGRMVEGVVGERNSVERDSFYYGLLDHPHYTRPASFRGMDVPEVLLSGHAERIRIWKKREALRATAVKRPDLLEKVELDDEARKLLEEIRNETTKSADAAD